MQLHNGLYPLIAFRPCSEEKQDNRGIRDMWSSDDTALSPKSWYALLYFNNLGLIAHGQAWLFVKDIQIILIRLMLI
jgi:hypothetical protein